MRFIIIKIKNKTASDIFNNISHTHPRKSIKNPNPTNYSPFCNLSYKPVASVNPPSYSDFANPFPVSQSSCVGSAQFPSNPHFQHNNWPCSDSGSPTISDDFLF